MSDSSAQVMNRMTSNQLNVQTTDYILFFFRVFIFFKLAKFSNMISLKRQRSISYASRFSASAAGIRVSYALFPSFPSFTPLVYTLLFSYLSFLFALHLTSLFIRLLYFLFFLSTKLYRYIIVVILGMGQSLIFEHY